MIPAPFDYVRPNSLAEAAELAASASDSGVILAGGQSLLTDLKQRRKRPRLVIDIGAIPGLDAIEVRQDSIRIGAMARQADIARHSAIVRHLPLLPQVAAVAADPMVRRRATLVGALCEVEPGGDWVAASLALDATVVGAGPSGDWEMQLCNLVRGPKRTALHPGAIATAVIFRLPEPRRAMRYTKAKHAAIGWSIASVAAVVDFSSDGRLSSAAIAVAGATATPQRLPSLEAALVGKLPVDEVQTAQEVERALKGLTLQGDYYASERYRCARLAVLIRRTLIDLARLTS